MRQSAQNPQEAAPIQFHPADAIPLTFEQTLNSQVLALTHIFEGIKLLFLEEDEIQLQFLGSPDVLNNRDYPTAFEKFKSFLKYRSNFEKRYQLPIQSFLGKQILRDHLTAEDRADTKRGSVVRPTKHNPQCFRFAIMANGAHIGDLFIVPIITKRIITKALLEKKSEVSFEAILVGTDKHSNQRRKKTRKQKSDMIIVEGYYYDDDYEVVGFSRASDRKIHEQEGSEELGQFLVDMIDEWIENHVNVTSGRRKKRDRSYENGWFE